MAKKLKCPFCGAELQETFGAYMCRHAGCKISCCLLPTCMIEALIQAKQDLAIVLKTLKKADAWFGDNQCLDPAKWIRRTVKQIEHKEQK